MNAKTQRNCLSNQKVREGGEYITYFKMCKFLAVFLLNKKLEWPTSFFVLFLLGPLVSNRFLTNLLFKQNPLK